MIKHRSPDSLAGFENQIKGGMQPTKTVLFWLLAIFWRQMTDAG